MISVKEFAAENRVSESIVYRHIRNHKTILGDRVQKAHGRTWLTDQGAAYIKNLMTQQTIIEEKASDVTKSMQKQLDEQRVTIEAQANIIELLKLKFERYEEDKKLLEEGKKEIKLLEGFIADAKAEIEVQKAQNAVLSADNEALGQKVAEAEKTAQGLSDELTEANMALETFLSGSRRERRKLRREFKKNKKQNVL